MKYLSRIAVAIVLFLSAGCTGNGESHDVEGAWQLVSGTGPDGSIDAPEGHRITLVFEGERVSGRSACNWYGGSARVTNARLKLDELSSTQILCEPAVMAAEAGYLPVLKGADRVQREADHLVITGSTGKLTFAALPPVPIEELVDTRWVLETLIVDEVGRPAGDEATLRVGSDGAIEGSTGCRGFSGRYVVRGDEVVVTELRMQEDPVIGRCGTEAARQDDIVVSVIGDGFEAEVEGDQLTLTSARHGLIFRSRLASAG